MTSWRGIREIPALYDVARRVCFEFGMPWTDPRTGQTHHPPKTAKKKAKKQAKRRLRK